MGFAGIRAGVDTILTSTTRFIANKKSWKNAAKRAKLERGWPVVFETGTHCRWMDRCFRKLGYRVSGRDRHRPAEGSDEGVCPVVG